MPSRRETGRHEVITMAATTMPTALMSIDLLESLGILRESTGRQRDREYRYDAYLRVLGAQGAAQLEGML